ncbi:MAG: hypothetical protein SFV18_03940 [Bryobacteraceae bacterium]|nr:hypothetical protein [Bryobacteraceae bacterium]
MRAGGLSVLFAAAALAQPHPPLGLLTADLDRWEGSYDGGHLLLKLDSALEYQCRFDGRSFFERDGRRVSIGTLRPGDRLEIMTDRTTNASLCFARRVKVMPAGYVAPQGLVRATEHFAPRGNLLYSGVVVRRDDRRFTIRVRDGIEHTVLLRPDTRFVLDGTTTDASVVAVNARIFVRAGLNLDDEVEAYQVVKGEIMQPERRAPRP